MPHQTCHASPDLVAPGPSLPSQDLPLLACLTRPYPAMPSPAGQTVPGRSSPDPTQRRLACPARPSPASPCHACRAARSLALRRRDRRCPAIPHLPCLILRCETVRRQAIPAAQRPALPLPAKPGLALPARSVLARRRPTKPRHTCRSIPHRALRHVATPCPTCHVYETTIGVRPACAAFPAKTVLPPQQRPRLNRVLSKQNTCFSSALFPPKRRLASAVSDS